VNAVHTHHAMASPGSHAPQSQEVDADSTDAFVVVVSLKNAQEV
jgi:hypothetical protein